MYQRVMQFHFDYVSWNDDGFWEKGANSVAFNSQFEDMMAYSGNGQLCVKANNFEPQSQHLQGFVVGE